MSDNIDDISTQINEIYPKIEPDDDSVDSSVRYAAYANRFRTILRSSHRYFAYTSDVGESFRPAISKAIVDFGYFVSFAYIIGDVSYVGWKAKLVQEGRYLPGLRPWDPTPKVNEELLKTQDVLDWKLVTLERAIFQGLASLALPAFTIHTTVSYATKFAEKNIKNKTIKLYGPIGLGLVTIPVLPYLFDKPLEHLLANVFGKLHEYNRKKLE